MSHLRPLLILWTTLVSFGCATHHPAGVLTSGRNVATLQIISATPTPKPIASATAMPSPRASSVPGDVVRLSGVVSVPKGLEANSSNVKNGKLVGSPLSVSDAVTGRVIKQGVTYYDGSFQLDVPSPAQLAAYVMSVDLVSAADAKDTLTLSAPIALGPGSSVQAGLVITPSTTALIDLYRRLATSSGAQAGDQFARYVDSTKADTLQAFSLLVAQDAAIAQASQVADLRGAIQAYVAHATMASPAP